MRKMKRQPTHPGRIIKEDYLTPLHLTITDMANKLGVSRKTLSKIINEGGAITPDMALRLARAFDTSPDLLAGFIYLNGAIVAIMVLLAAIPWNRALPATDHNFSAG